MLCAKLHIPLLADVLFFSPMEHDGRVIILPYPLHKISMHYIKYRMNKFLDWAWVGIITAATDAIIPFFIPVRWYIIFMICSVSADTVTGIMASIKVKQKITSRGIWRTLEKISVASVAILTSHGFELLFIPDIPITKGVAMIIAFAELKSIFENYHKITGVELGTSLLDMIKERIPSFKKPETPQDSVSDEDIYDRP